MVGRLVEQTAAADGVPVSVVAVDAAGGRRPGVLDFAHALARLAALGYNVPPRGVGASRQVPAGGRPETRVDGPGRRGERGGRPAAPAGGPAESRVSADPTPDESAADMPDPDRG